VGGVDAARRVGAGEAFDAVFLAAEAIDTLLVAGALAAGSRVDLVRSPMALAVPAGTPLPDIASEAALKQALLAAPSLAYSTGPSGTQLLGLFERWGLAEAMAPKLIRAQAGVPVGALLARGEAALGVQQLSELIGVEGVVVVGLLPGAAQFITTFSGAVGACSARADEVRALLGFMAAPESADAKRRHGMQPV